MGNLKACPMELFSPTSEHGSVPAVLGASLLLICVIWVREAAQDHAYSSSTQQSYPEQRLPSTEQTL